MKRFRPATTWVLYSMALKVLNFRFSFSSSWALTCRRETVCGESHTYG